MDVFTAALGDFLQGFGVYWAFGKGNQSDLVMFRELPNLVIGTQLVATFERVGKAWGNDKQFQAARTLAITGAQSN